MQQAARLLAICVFGLGVAQTGTAEACIKFDRVAEVRTIDRGIASPETSAAQKAELKSLRQKMRQNRGTSSEQLVAYHEAVTQAMKVLGKSRIVYRDIPSKPGRQAGIVPQGSCG
jgi:hypothetical protein